jgi:hypothetical protein
MIPEVKVPKKAKIRVPVEFKLKRTWRFDQDHRVFKSRSGKEFSPLGHLPRNSKIVYKVPSLAHSESAGMTRHERKLRHYMQVILPAGESPADYLETIQAWPCVAEADVGPDVSLP